MVGKSRMVGETLEIWLGFRGTSNVVEGIMDSYLELVTLNLGPINESHGQVHKGFLRAYRCLQPGLFSELDCQLQKWKRQKVVFHITGHSLGGALATLCAYQVASAVGDCPAVKALSSLKREVRCVTWGSPKVGDANFRKKYQEVVHYTARMVNRWDVVP